MLASPAKADCTTSSEGAVTCTGAGFSLDLDDVNIHTQMAPPTGVAIRASNQATVNANGGSIETEANGSYGLIVTGGGIINVNNVDIVTWGTCSGDGCTDDFPEPEALAAHGALCSLRNYFVDGRIHYHPWRLVRRSGLIQKRWND